MKRIAVVSDVHYAGPREQAHGADFEFETAAPSWRRSLVQLYRNTIWMRNPVGHNAMLETFMDRAADADLVVGNGDFTCDVAGVGVSHDDACESVQLCLDQLRERFGERFEAVIGDHELGKVSLLGDHGGLRVRSWERATRECGLKPFWRRECGGHVLFGVTSTLLGLPVFRPDALEEEWATWEQLRAAHVAEVRAAFTALERDQRVVLFCHDPTALAFLWSEPAVQERAHQIALTVIGHLHTRLVFWKGRLLAGMPVLHRLGVSVKRMSTALNQARCWKHFHPVLCPALAGIELHKRGGFLMLELDGDHVRVRRERLRRG
jgi:hypothetical protein